MRHCSITLLLMDCCRKIVVRSFFHSTWYVSLLHGIEEACVFVSSAIYLSLSPGRGAEYCNQPICLCISLSVCVCVCLSVSISLEPLDRSSRIFVSSSPVAVAWSSSGSVTLHYVLQVLWMTSRLAVVGQGWQRLAALSVGDQLRARPGRSLMSMNACFLDCNKHRDFHILMY